MLFWFAKLFKMSNYYVCQITKPKITSTSVFWWSEDEISLLVWLLSIAQREKMRNSFKLQQNDANHPGCIQWPHNKPGRTKTTEKNQSYLIAKLVSSSASAQLTERGRRRVNQKNRTPKTAKTEKYFDVVIVSSLVNFTNAKKNIK